MAVKHRVVVMREVKPGVEEHERAYPWMSPSEAEYLSDKVAAEFSISDDPTRYISIESDAEEVESCPL